MPHPDRLALAVESGELVLPDSGRVLVLRAEPGRFLDFVPAERLACEQTFRPVHDALLREDRPVAVRALDGPAASVVVMATRSRAETLGAIARGFGLLEPGGLLVLSGAKAEGVDGVAKLLAGLAPIEGTYVKAHGRVVWLRRPEVLPPAVAQWQVAAAPSRNAEGFLTAPGMFSPEHADPGSRQLAAALDGRLAGRVADLGAGWGWLAHAALAACPKIVELDLHEAEALALDAARQNVADPRARFHWSDVGQLGGRAGAGACDWVIANPPFHQGRAPDPALGASFIAAAARLLKPAGRFLMVANRQLPYEAPLTAAFREWEKIEEHGGYKLFLAGRPKRG